MKFKFECDDLDGLVLIDKSYLSELNDDMIYALDVLLDSQGQSELIYDFPNEEWSTVRARETKHLREFCNSGKMLIWLSNDVDKVCKFEEEKEISVPSKWLHLPSGKLLAITAGELIECWPYLELQMEQIFELDIEQGWYAISGDSIDKICYCKKEPQNSVFNNVQE
ncbi:MAG: hypothetical protein K2O41_04260 [Clostridia bacterium]|nr:hypothetical protein [Clostridia bacterium]